MRANDATGRAAAKRSDRKRIAVLGGAGEEKEIGRPSRAREKERKEMKGARFACRGPMPFIRGSNLVAAVRAWPRRVFLHQLKKTVDTGRTVWQPNNDSPCESNRPCFDSPGPFFLSEATHGQPKRPESF